MSIATMTKRAAKAIGLPVDESDIYREARHALPTVDDLKAAEEAQKKASRDLQLALQLVAAGENPPAYAQRFRREFDHAAHRVRTIRAAVQKRRDLSPPGLREDCYRSKQRLVRATTRRDKLAEEITEQKKQNAKLAAALEERKGKEGFVRPGDLNALEQLQREFEKAQRDLVAGQRELEHLEESFNEALQDVFTCESTYNTLNHELLTG